MSQNKSLLPMQICHALAKKSLVQQNVYLWQSSLKKHNVNSPCDSHFREILSTKFTMMGVGEIKALAQKVFQNESSILNFKL